MLNLYLNIKLNKLIVKVKVRVKVKVVVKFESIELNRIELINVPVDLTGKFFTQMANGLLSTDDDVSDGVWAELMLLWLEPWVICDVLILFVVVVTVDPIIFTQLLFEFEFPWIWFNPNVLLLCSLINEWFDGEVDRLLALEEEIVEEELGDWLLEEFNDDDLDPLDGDGDAECDLSNFDCFEEFELFFFFFFLAL